MPIYTFRNKVTGEEDERNCTILEMEETLKNNPDLHIVPAVPKFMRGRGLKIDDGFNDILKTVKKQNPGSTIRTK